MAHAVTAAGLDADLKVRRGAFSLNVSLSIPPGRTVALLGPNGAGKSTAVALVAGLLSLDAGRITLGGVTLDDPVSNRFVPPQDRRVGVVFQDYLLFAHLTVIDNVAFGLRSRGVRHREARRRAGEWLARLSVDGVAERKPGSLSGGQAQRVALARALVTEPAVLLLDEPLSALDASATITFRRLLADHLAAFPGPRLLITHDPTEAFLLADEIHVIEAGRITQSGSAEDIWRRPRTPYAADLAGSNLVTGIARGGVVDTGSHLIHIADAAVAGPVLATIRAASVSVHRRRPEGSPRNAWRTTLERIEQLGERVRLLVGDPLPLTVEVTRGAMQELDLAAGSELWVSIEATDIEVAPNGGSPEGGVADH